MSLALCTNRADTIARFVKELQDGTVNVREAPGYGLKLTPFAGIKASGLGYKEGVQEAMKCHTHLRPIRRCGPDAAPFRERLTPP